MKHIERTLLFSITAIFLSGCLFRPDPSTSGSTSGKTSTSGKSNTSGKSSTSHIPFTTSIPSGNVKEPLEHEMSEYIDNNYFEFSNCPYNGEVKTLVIPIWFKDSNNFITTSAHKQTVLEDIEKGFNAKGTDLGWYSLSSFYEEESLGKLKVSAVVSDWYESSYSYVDVATEADQGKEISLMKTAVSSFFSSSSYSRKDFDSDGNGYLDSVVFVYGCPDFRTLGRGDYDNLWAYTSWLMDSSQKSKSVPGMNVFMWCSYDFMYSSSDAYKKCGTSYGTGDTRFTEVDSHTFIHEFGHVLGLPDYYDYSDYNYTPAGCFSMQDWNVGAHDPFSSLLFKWSEVYKPTKSTTIEIKDFQSSHDLILLSSHEVTSVFDEYFLLELYTPTGLNELDSEHRYAESREYGPSVPGIRLWHIDARLLNFVSYSSFDSKYITDPTAHSGYGVYWLESNSYGGNSASFAGKEYYNYNTLQLIRNNRVETYTPTSPIYNNDLFKEGSSFYQNTFRTQFVKGSRFNDGTTCEWSFSVEKIVDDTAIIELTLN